MRTHATHPTSDELAAFDAGTLPADSVEAIERHVANCEVCCRVLEALPEDPLAARIREFATPVTVLGGDTERRDATSPMAVPSELVGHPRFEILGLIGTGGMGAVYRAKQKQLDRTVAVKILHRRLTESTGFADRFRHEMQALARLNHPNIVQAYDADQAGDSHFLVMEFVAGESLQSLVLRRGPLPGAEACELARQVAIGLQQAHEQQLVHRDIKPGNLLLANGGVVKIADFGLARLVGSAEPAEPGSAPLLVGTPEYMAPEQARDPAKADIRSDLYSLGCTLYFLLAGRPPLSGASHLQTLLNHQDMNPAPIVGITNELGSILARLLAKEPNERFATPAEVVDALSRVATPNFARSRHRSWFAAAIAASAIVVAAAAIAFSVAGPRDEPPDAHSHPVESPPIALAVAPPPHAADHTALATPEEILSLRRKSADEAIAWVRANNRWKPEAEIAVKTATRIDNLLPKVDGLVLTFGGNLLKSGKPTLLAARPGGFFVFELTPEQTKLANVGPINQVFSWHSHTADPRLRVPRVQLSNFNIDAANDHPSGGRIEGAIDCELPDPAGPDDHLRITHYRGDGRRITYSHYPKPLPTGSRVTLRFSASPIELDRQHDERVEVVFAEWATWTEKGDVIQSNTAAAIVVLRDDR
jgi:Protein kinase domain